MLFFACKNKSSLMAPHARPMIGKYAVISALAKFIDTSEDIRRVHPNDMETL